MKERNVWLAVTNDVFEIPIANADTALELAAILGITFNHLRKILKKYNGIYQSKEIKIVKVRIEDD